jgi:ribosomal protein S6--L-glutamate ligase
VAQGGRTEKTQPNSIEENLALAAAQAVSADIAGVDLLPDKNGAYYVLEVNAVPGWRALGKTTRIDVARKIVEYSTTAAEHRRTLGL